MIPHHPWIAFLGNYDPIFIALAVSFTLVLALIVHNVLRPSSKKKEAVDRATAEMGSLVDVGGWEDDDGDGGGQGGDDDEEEEDVDVIDAEDEEDEEDEDDDNNKGGGKRRRRRRKKGGGAMSDAAAVAAINSSWDDRSDKDLKKQKDSDESAGREGGGGGVGGGNDEDAAEDGAEDDGDEGEEEEEGPFKVGDRVVLGGLKKAAHLNGRHGVVAGRPKSTRYPVDLDLLDPPTKTNRVSVRSDNLSAETAIENDGSSYRASVHEGRLEERHGQAVAFIFDTMQCLVGAQFLGDPSLGTLSDLYRFRQAGGPQAMAKCNALQGSAWSLWTDPGPFGPRTQGKSVYDRLKFTLQQSVVQQNGGFDQIDAKHPGGYRLIYDSMDDPKAAGGWQCRLHGTFWVAMSDPDGSGTYLIPDSNRNAVYKIVGHRAALNIKGGPALFRMTIVPWYGRLVWDGSLETTKPGPPAQASPDLTRRLIAAVERAVRQGRVVDRLAQLEVPGGSRAAVQPPPLRIRPSPTDGAGGAAAAAGGGGPPATAAAAAMGGVMGASSPMARRGAATPRKPQPEPTTQEKKLMAKIAPLPPYPCRDPRTFGPKNPPSPIEREGHWVMQRKGITKKTNPKGEGVVLRGVGLGGGHPVRIGSFVCRDAASPTAVELLVALATLAVKEGRRPSMVGVDEMEVAERLGFLFKDTPGTVVFAFVQKGGPTPPPPTPTTTPTASTAAPAAAPTNGTAGK